VTGSSFAASRLYVTNPISSMLATLSLASIQQLQKLPRRQNSDMAELFHCQQIIIASNDYIGFAGERRRERDVIIFVATDALTQSCRRDDLGLVMERSQQWQLVRSRLKFVA
jgi:hypothetical protein